MKERETTQLQNKIHEIIFGHTTAAGKAFDIILLFFILASVAVLMIDSVGSIANKYGFILTSLEWGFTFFFSVEYLLRVYSARNPLKYITSFFGIIDLLSILPTYLGIFMTGSHYLQTIRTFRLLRVFRILGLSTYVGQATALLEGFRLNRQKITVFFGVVLSINILIGTLMFLVEGPEHGFTSIPRSIYWAIVTMTTVGYGDIAPQTTLGQSIAAFAMIIAYAIIATGIVSLNLQAPTEQIEAKPKEGLKECNSCKKTTIEPNQKFCSNCGDKL
ncbi:ion transporter [Salibacteraceae bacterium]|jgi:voltage-gated potassium channel|nr:ion transporter [Crocinitomicaceae bacterium]MDB0058308.1 ion transporter [Salibacteraceae bacterium]|tara:strand:- start:96253 stop:97077 length:825 start_codon:yes stop_codon:yes gene_type:complete